MQPQEQQLFSIHDVLTVLFKHKYKILGTLLLGLVVTGIVLVLIPKQFVARGVVLVKPGREFVSISEVGDTKPQISQESIMRTEMQILTSQDLILRVINAIGPEGVFPGLSSLPPGSRAQAAIPSFRENLGVNPVKGSNLLEVYFRSPNPQVAAQVVNTLIEYLKDKHLQVFSDPKSSFLEAQLKEYQEKLRQSEGAVGNFKQRNDVFSLDEQRSLLIKERADIESNLKANQLAVRELQQKMNYLRDRKDFFTDGTVSELKSRLIALEQKEQELTEKYNDSSQVVVSHRKEMQLVRDQLRKYEDQARNTEMTKIQADLEPLQVKIAGLQKRYNEVDRGLRSLDSRTREFVDLRRESAANEANYETYLKKTEEARISEDLDRRKMTNITVIEQAAMMPAKSNQQKTLGIGIFLTVVVAFGLAYIAEYIPHRMTTPQSAEKKLGLPVLVAIPKKTNHILTAKALSKQA